VATRTGQQIQKLNFYNVYNTPHDFTLNWTESVPSDTSTKVEISFDQGDSWVEVQNGIAESGTIQNVNTDGYTDLYVRITLEAVDTGNNPTFEDLWMTVELAGTEPFSTDAVSILSASGDRIDCFLWYDRDMPSVFTTLFKVKMNNLTSNHVFFDWIYYDGSSYSTSDRVMFWYDSSADEYKLDVNGTTSIVLSGGDTDWHDFAVRVESSNVYVFIDGEQELNYSWSGMTNVPNRLFVGHNYSFGDILDGSITDWLIDEELQDDAAIKFHHEINMPWFDPTDIRNQQNNVVINKSGIRMNKAEYAQYDKKDRTIDIGTLGILVRDSNGKIIHDILNEPLTQNYYMGHLYWLDESVDSELISTGFPNIESWEEVTCVTLENDNARGGLFKVSFSGEYESGLAIERSWNSVLMRPNGTTWSPSVETTIPSLQATVYNDDNDRIGIEGLLICPIGDDNKVEWYLGNDIYDIQDFRIIQLGIFL
jgi:hypothetical protein